MFNREFENLTSHEMSLQVGTTIKDANQGSLKAAQDNIQ